MATSSFYNSSGSTPAVENSIQTAVQEAAGSATQAATSANNAATSETNAQSSLNSFQQYYLGAYSSAPSTTQSGAMYFDTGTSQLYIWSGTSWDVTASANNLQDTDGLSEGSSNLYFTNERVDDRVNALLTAGSNVTLTYNDTANTLTIASTASGGGGATTFLGLTDTPAAYTGQAYRYLMVNSTADGVTTVTPDTDDVAEGSTNLYHTDERVDDRVNSLLTAGSNITLNYDDAANILTIASTASGGLTDLSSSDTDDLSEGTSNLYHTDERVDDRVNSLLTAGSNINLTYDDAANTLTIASTASGGGGGIALTDLSVSQSAASGTGLLAYNNTTGQFSYIPPDLSGYATTASLATVATSGAYGDLTGTPNLSSYLTGITGESLYSLSNVYSSSNPSDGQVLTYDTTNGWQPETPSTFAAANYVKVNSSTGTTVAGGNDAIAIGYIANSSANKGISIGYAAKSAVASDISIGDQANNVAGGGGNSIGIGNQSVSDGIYSIALGTQADAGHNSAVAVGVQAVTTAQRQLMLGAPNNSSGFTSIQVGNTSYTPTVSMDLTTKSYVDTAVSNAGGGGSSDLITGTFTTGSTSYTLVSVFKEFTDNTHYSSGEITITANVGSGSGSKTQLRKLYYTYTPSGSAAVGTIAFSNGVVMLGGSGSQTNLFDARITADYLASAARIKLEVQCASAVSTTFNYSILPVGD